MISYLIVAHCTFFWVNLSLNSKSILVRIPFLWTWVHFKPVFCRTLQTVFYDYSFYTKITISSCKHLVCLKIILFCQTYLGLEVFPNLSFVTTKSPIFFFILHMPAGACFWILSIWFHLWYFWISLSCILMLIAPINWYIQWNSL